jgi:hypothetical protein
MIPYFAGIFLFLTPHFINNYQRFGDPLESVNHVGRFYRNVEFKGQPGFVTEEEFLKDGRAGPKITTLEYLITLHTPGQLIQGSIKGMWDMFFAKYPIHYFFRLHFQPTVDSYSRPVLTPEKAQSYEIPFYLLYLIGIVCAFRYKNGWLIPAIIFLVQAPMAYMVGAGLIHHRLLANPVVFMHLLSGLGLSVIISGLIKIKKPDVFS